VAARHVAALRIAPSVRAANVKGEKSALENRLLRAAEEEAVAAQVAAAQPRARGRAGEPGPLPRATVRQDRRAGVDGGVAVTDERHAAARVHGERVAVVEVAASRRLRKRVRGAQHVAAERAVELDAADVAARQAEEDGRAGGAG